MHKFLNKMTACLIGNYNQKYHSDGGNFPLRTSFKEADSEKNNICYIPIVYISDEREKFVGKACGETMIDKIKYRKIYRVKEVGHA